MALKTQFTDAEAYGLTQEEKKIGLRYLRKHKTAGVIKEVEAAKLFELFMIGLSFQEIQEQYPQYELGQLILTSCLRKWMQDRESMTWQLQDRIKARIIKSVVGQVDFLTLLLEVSSAEHIKKMREFILDPKSASPKFKVKSLKEYQLVADLLMKISGVSQNNNKGQAPMLKGVSVPKPKKISSKSAADMLEGMYDKEEE